MELEINTGGLVKSFDNVRIDGEQFISLTAHNEALANSRRLYADKIMKLETENSELKVMNAELNESHNELISDYRKKLNHIEVLQGNKNLLERNNQKLRERNASLELVKDPQLNEAEWEALAKAERPLYTPFMGVHAFTDVMEREDGQLAAHIWGQVEMAIEMSFEDWDSYKSDRQRSLIAQRVARVLAVISFGTEYLLR